METRRYGEASVLHLEPETYARLLDLAETAPAVRAALATTLKTRGTR